MQLDLKEAEKFFLGAILIVVFMAACDNRSTAPGYKTKNVIIIVIDGPRYSETWGDPQRQYTPRLANQLSGKGILYTNFYNKGPTYTAAGHTAITTGYYQEINNGGSELPEYPSIFQHWLQAHGGDKSSAWLITSKDKLEVLSDCLDPAWKGKYNPATNCGIGGLGSGVREDAATYTTAKDILSSRHPRLVLIHFKEPDFSAHAGSWENYINGIKNTDEYLFQLWDFIETDPFYKGSTALFMTNDHGRHLDSTGGFTSHGDSCPGCRHINLFAYGPDFKQGALIDVEREQIDIPATVATMLNFEMPNCKGEVMRELFN
jgi:hypothetical protein